MVDNLSNKADLQATALNDIEVCVQRVFAEPFVQEKWDDMYLSLHAALNLGVTQESVLSKFLNSMPTESKMRIASLVAKRRNLSPTKMEELLAPED